MHPGYKKVKSIIFATSTGTHASYTIFVAIINLYIQLIPSSTSSSCSLSIESKSWVGRSRLNGYTVNIQLCSRICMAISLSHADPPQLQQIATPPPRLYGVQGMGVQRHLSFRSEAKIKVVMSCVPQCLMAPRLIMLIL